MMNDELFKIELTGEGRYWLKRFSSLSLLILIFTVVVSTLTLFRVLPGLLSASQTERSTFNRYQFVNVVTIGWFLTNFLLQCLQVVFYYSFARRSQHAIDNENSTLFNNSFRFLFWQAVVFLMQVVSGFLYYSYSYYLLRY